MCIVSEVCFQLDHSLTEKVWTPFKPTIYTRNNPCMQVYGNHLFIINGACNSDNIPDNVIEMIDLDDSASVWTEATTVPSPAYTSGSAVYDNYIFIIGGLSCTGSSAVGRETYLYDALQPDQPPQLISPTFPGDL